MTLANRAFSAIQVRAVSAGGRRTFSGWATTPAVDRMGDTVDPMGVRFAASLPLLHQHRHDQPVGQAIFGKPTKRGVPFTGEIPLIDSPPTLKERVDVAWAEVQHGLVPAVSIGFRPIKYAFRDDGGVDYQEIEVYELSLVTIPALPQAVITTISKAMHGGELPADVVRMIHDADTGARSGGGIALVASGLPLGAVRLGT